MGKSQKRAQQTKTKRVSDLPASKAKAVKGGHQRVAGGWDLKSNPKV